MINGKNQKESAGWPLWILNLVLIAALGGAGWYSLRATNRLKTLYEKRREISRQTVENAYLGKLLAETASLREKIHQSIIGPDSLPGFIEELETLAAAAGADFEVASAAPSLASDGAALTLELAARGSFESLWQFSRLLEILPKQFVWKQIEFNQIGTGEEGGENAEWQARFVLALLSHDKSDNEN